MCSPPNTRISTSRGSSPCSEERISIYQFQRQMGDGTVIHMGATIDTIGKPVIRALRVGTLVDVQVPQLIYGNGIQVVSPKMIEVLKKNPDWIKHVRVIHEYEKSIDVLNKLVSYMVS